MTEQLVQGKFLEDPVLLKRFENERQEILRAYDASFLNLLQSDKSIEARVLKLNVVQSIAFLFISILYPLMMMDYIEDNYERVFNVENIAVVLCGSIFISSCTYWLGKIATDSYLNVQEINTILDQTTKDLQNNNFAEGAEHD